jgi:hypothetical protein
VPSDRGSWRGRYVTGTCLSLPARTPRELRLWKASSEAGCPCRSLREMVEPLFLRGVVVCERSEAPIDVGRCVTPRRMGETLRISHRNGRDLDDYQVIHGSDVESIGAT